MGKAEGENTTHHMERGVGLQQRTDTICFRRKESCKAGRELACRTMALCHRAYVPPPCAASARPVASSPLHSSRCPSPSRSSVIGVGARSHAESDLARLSRLLMCMDGG